MTLDEAIRHCEEVAKENERIAFDLTTAFNMETIKSKECKKCANEHRQLAEWLKDYKRLKKQESCEDAISKQTTINTIANTCFWLSGDDWNELMKCIESIPFVIPKPKIGHCKNCKYFEYDSVAKVDGIPLIVAHEICSRWGDGCKTKEDGYCFLFEPQESEGI